MVRVTRDSDVPLITVRSHSREWGVTRDSEVSPGRVRCNSGKTRCHSETTRCHLSDCLIGLAGLGVILVVIAAVVHVTGGEVIIQNRHVEPNALDASLYEFITYSCTIGNAGSVS